MATGEGRRSLCRSAVSHFLMLSNLIQFPDVET